MFMLVAFALLFCTSMIRAGVPCETGVVTCPQGTRCVANVGCVPQNTTNCRCPAQACVWPQECNCKGACAPRLCSATKGCGTSVNPHDACQVTICRQGRCVATPAACENCDPQVGCKTGTKTGTTTTTTDTNNGNVQNKNEWGSKDVHVKDVEPDRHNNVIGMWVVVAVVLAAFLATGFFFAFIVNRS